ncbi:ATP-binding protein [Kitasatospora sp. GP30]|uniref:ATP-binding protein n=1 Tax=Kitasatospora sp. GP30 TaxID=3035084 RepID=UPI0015D61126|nr:ATP-binding protein [Kitasatospora sp. GP30]
MVTQVAGIALDEDRLYALRVCFSEVIANGIEHGFLDQPPGDARVLVVEGDLDSDQNRLRVTVTDGGRLSPTMKEAVEDLWATGGRGLAVVRGYSDGVGWGSRTNADGDTTGWSVWFELRVQIQEMTHPVGCGEVLSGVDAHSGASRKQSAGSIRAAARRGLRRVRSFRGVAERYAA